MCLRFFFCLVFPLLVLASVGREHNRFRVTVEIKGANQAFVATIKDAWGSYLGQQPKDRGWKVRFDDVPQGDYSVRVEFASGAHLWKSFRVDAEQASPKGELEVKLRASDAVHTADSIEASNVVSTAELRLPEEARELFEQAWKQMGVSNWAEARRLYQEAVEVAPDYFDAWNNLGVVTRKLDDFEGAVRYFQHALRLNRDSFSANVNLSEALLQMGRLDEAIQVARRAYRIRPEDPISNAQLGSHLFRAERYRECIPYLEKVAAQDPQSYYYPQISLAVAHEKLGEPDAALRQVEDWLRHHPTNPNRPTVEAKRRELLNRVSAMAEEAAQ